MAAPARLRRRLAAVAVLASVAVTTAMLAVVPLPPAVAAPTNTLHLKVESARTEPRAFDGAGVTKGAAVSDYKFIINKDDTGTTRQRNPQPGSGCAASDPGYPRSCDWPSIYEPSGWAPIITQGNQDDLANGIDLPDGRYLISVLADGYAIDGAHFSMPLQTADPITVGLEPDPLPDSTMKGQVFMDNAPTNWGIDVGEETLKGFQAHVVDYLGEVQTDVYGNPLCTTYNGENPVTHEIPKASLDAEMQPVVDQAGGKCLSDADGIVTVPHLGPNRYTLSVTPPNDGQTWIQTTTLEGNHDYDSWQLPGDTGFDNTFAVGGEQIPLPNFGFVHPLHNGAPLNGTAAGHVKGSVVGINTYTPPKGGSFDFWGGNTGTKVKHAIDKPWLSLDDLDGGDVAVWVGQGNSDGTFDISGVPDGNYSLSWWDEPQDYNLNVIQLTVKNGETVNMGTLPLNGWWTEYEGYVFDDANRNGTKDPGEKGVPNFTLTLRKRENNLTDRGQNTVTTDANGHYYFESGYPWGEWFILEAYDDRYYTTGVTYQADNEKQPTTVKGAGVDVSTLPIIGLGGKMDFGVHAYDAAGTSNGADPRNGGIVGTVSYDTTRNELDPQYAASEDWQPGISGVPVKLYATIDCPTDGSAPCDPSDRYQLAPDGSYAKGKLLNEYTSESWQRPKGCTARDVDGNPLVHMADNPTKYDENVLVPDQETNGECISSFMQGIQFGTYGTDQGTPDANFGAAVNGNYGFGDGCFDGTLGKDANGDPTCDGGSFTSLGAADYLVEVDIPKDQSGKPMYKATGEEDINIGNGDQIVPQVPPPACAGALHTVDLKGDGTDGYGEVVGDGSDVPTGVTVPPSTTVDNGTFLDIGGSPYEGTARPNCDTKLVNVSNGKSIVPMFNLFTDVPIPGRLRTVIIDDLNFSADPRSIMYGEKAGLAFAPVGIYDYANRLVYTTETDFNGIYDVLMPSTNHISCPTPSGVCAGMYRVVANDPGIPGRLNPNYNPQFRTHAAGAETIPGISTFADLAPTQVGLNIESPKTGASTPVSCPIDAATPQLLRVSDPYVNGSGSFTIDGTGFGATKGTGKVTLDGTTLPTSGTWNDTRIAVTVPAGTPVGPHQLKVTTSNGRTTTNGLTFHVLGTGYNPALRTVGPGKTYSTIQAALDAAYSTTGNDDLVVVYPGTPDPNPRVNPRGAYYENLVMASPVKLQGVGPGGFQGNTYVPGSIIDASSFGGDTDLATAWFNKVGGYTWDGSQVVNDGEGIYVLASQNANTTAGRARQFTAGFKAGIDGFDLRGGEQNGYPGNINDITGGSTGLPPSIETQGGAIFANAYARYLQITNNVVQNNGASYGTIRIGTPDLPAADANQHNENVRIANNRVIANAGTNLAGGIGLFAGSDNYEVSDNDICGNFSLEYGGGVSVVGLSPNGKIHHNRIALNMSNDEGGGIMIAGALPLTPGELSPGSGSVDIYANKIQANISNDDGGGIRFLMAGNSPMNVQNNMIVNNVSTHEGGGVSLNDAPDVRVVNNTIMKNLTTATAVTSDGTAAPAGLSTTANSDQLQKTLPAGANVFSKPKLFNNIFWDNRAGTRSGQTSTGLGLPGDTLPIDQWDMGVTDTTGSLTPTSSVVQQVAAEHPYTDSATNSHAAPSVVQTFDVSVSFKTWRQNPAFVDATLVTVDAPPDQMGDYHLSGCPSPACNRGAASAESINAPTTDIDDQQRPALGGYDAGADEYGATAAPPPGSTSELYYSTTGNTNPSNLTTGTADDADIYKWNGTANSREWDASTHGVPAGANIDGVSRVDANHFYVSFTGDVTLPGIAGTVADEDVVYYDNGTWKTWFDGSAHGLNGLGTDLDAISVVGQTLYFSTDNTTVPPGAGGSGDDADLYRWNGASTYTRVADASALGWSTANVDGLVFVDATHVYLSYSADTAVPGLGTVQDEDVVYDNAGTWSVAFDGTAHGLGASSNQDIDAISFATGAAAPPLPPPPPPFKPLFLSTRNGGVVPGVAGPYEGADVYSGNGTSYSRAFDASAAGVLGSALSNVDGYDRVDATHYYVSFDGPALVLGPGPLGVMLVQDEDVLYNNNGVWSLYFDGSAHGFPTTGARNTDIDAFSLVGNTLYFSTDNAVLPTGVGGTGDDSDIYSWNGTSYARVWDASANGIPAAANVDGYSRASASHFYLSFSGPTTSVAGVGNVQDEDVVEVNGAARSVYYDGTAQGLTADNQDVDAFDVP